jgi:hypothetical protein
LYTAAMIAGEMIQVAELAIAGSAAPGVGSVGSGKGSEVPQWWQ